MFFKKAVPAEDLASELVAFAQQTGHQTGNQILELTGNTGKEEVAYVNKGVDGYVVLWAATACAAGERYKEDKTARLCSVALDLIQRKLVAFPEAVATGRTIVKDTPNDDQKFSALTSGIFGTAFPDLDIKPNEVLIPGMNLVSSVNYGDYLVRENKIAW